MTHSSKSLPQQQIEFLENSRILYLPIAGGWPPNVRDKKELDELRTLIIKDIESAKLFIDENPDILEGHEIYADLLRMAHNVNVPDAAQKSENVLKEILKNNRMLLSGGLGYRNKGVFVDLTYVHSIMKDTHVPYYLTDRPNTFAEGNNIKGNVMLTFGAKF